MQENKIPVILDCDPGIDDAVAIMLAYALPQLDIKAVTTVAGNVGIEKTTANARMILATLGVQGKIYKGATGPLLGGRVIEAPEAHGVGGLGSYTMPESGFHPLEEMSALEAQRKIIMESDTPVTIVAVGPLTNIAILIRSYPEVIANIKQISLMGGGLYSGNHTEAAEFNILADPEAADVVYESKIPIIMAGLDVTHKARIYGNQVAEIKAVGNQVSGMIAEILSFYFEKLTPSELDKQYCCMHDSVSVLAVLYPEMFEGRDLRVMVETAGRFCRGYTLADMRRKPQGEPNCHVLLNIDNDRFFQEILKAVKSYS